VPHYVTSTPVIADTYAELIFAFRRDRQALFPGHEPLYIWELGSGSGRFAFHFLKRLLPLCARRGAPPFAFRYMLTDFTQSNLDAVSSSQVPPAAQQQPNSAPERQDPPESPSPSPSPPAGWALMAWVPGPMIVWPRGSCGVLQVERRPGDELLD